MQLDNSDLNKKIQKKFVSEIHVDGAGVDQKNCVLNRAKSKKEENSFKTPLSFQLEDLIQKGLLWCPVSEEKRDSSEINLAQLAENRLTIDTREDRTNQIQTSISNLDRDLGGGLQSNAIHTFSGAKIDDLDSAPILFCSYLAIEAKKRSERSPNLSSINSNRDRSLHNPTNQKPIVWLGDRRFWPTPWLLRQLTDDIGISSCIFVETSGNKDLVWAIKAVLTSKSVSAIVAPLPKLPFRDTQSLSILARSSGCITFLLSEKFVSTTSGYYSHWIVEPRYLSENSLTDLPQKKPLFSLLLKKTKGKQPYRNRWDITFNNGKFTDDQSIESMGIENKLIQKNLDESFSNIASIA
jgi:hypothetical protein